MVTVEKIFCGWKLALSYDTILYPKSVFRIKKIGGALSVTVNAVGNGIRTRVQILGVTVCVSPHANALEKGMKPSLRLCPIYGLNNLSGLGSLTLVRQPVYENENWI